MIDLSWLAENGPCKIFTAGQKIPCPGGTEKSERAMYILLVGRVDISGVGKKNQQTVSLFPGDVFGGKEYFTDIIENTYTAVVDSVVYVVSESSFNDLSWSQPDILFDILKAAYMPLGKPAAPATPAGAKAAGSAAGPLAAMGAARNAKAPGAAKAADAIKAAGSAEVAAAPGAQSDQHVKSEPQAPIPVVCEVFPEGHKLYPDIMKPEYKNLVFLKEYTCPYCKKQFTDYRIARSKLYESSPTRYDMRKYYTDFQPEWYEIVTCQSCLFSMFSNYFTEPKSVLKAKIENNLTSARASVLLDFDGDRTIDYVFTAHYLALICAEGYLTSARQLRAKLWGNLSWLYEDVEDDAMARFSAEKAAEAYETVYKETMLNPTQEQITCLSIAGMQHRAGVDNNMKRYLFTAKTLKDGDKIYAKLAEDFMEELNMSDEKDTSKESAVGRKKKK